jgi:hypothetical protein
MQNMNLWNLMEIISDAARSKFVYHTSVDVSNIGTISYRQFKYWKKL